LIFFINRAGRALGLPVRFTLAKINVLDREVGVVVENDEDYICITDIARYRNAKEY